MAIAEKQQELVPVEVVEPTNVLSLVERMAANPDVDVAKLEKLIEMQERILKHQAKAAFDGSFAQMQSEMPEISEHGKLTVKGQVRSTYAKLEDIQAAIKPVLKKFGFAIRHRTEWPDGRDGIIRIVGILSHSLGHSEESAFEAPMDRSEYRTDIQSMGSTVSYGRRYTMLDLLNITTRGIDRDGAAPAGPAPEGYAGWLATLKAKADEGMAALTGMWNTANRDADLKPFVSHLMKTDLHVWNELKKRAGEVK